MGVVNLSWGKPKKVVITRHDGLTSDELGIAGEYKNIVEDSAELSTEQGDKLEAPIEGGENEAELQKPSKYQFTMALRQGGGDNFSPQDDNGVITATYDVEIFPGNAGAAHVKVNNCACSIDKTWKASEGAKFALTFKTLAPGVNEKSLEFVSSAG